MSPSSPEEPAGSVRIKRLLAQLEFAESLLSTFWRFSYTLLPEAEIPHILVQLDALEDLVTGAEYLLRRWRNGRYYPKFMYEQIHAGESYGTLVYRATLSGDVPAWYVSTGYSWSMPEKGVAGQYRDRYRLHQGRSYLEGKKV